MFFFVVTLQLNTSPLSFSPVGEMQVTPYIEGVLMPRVSVPPLRGRLGGGWWQLVFSYIMIDLPSPPNLSPLIH